MHSRRRFLQFSFAALTVSAARAVLSNADPPDVPAAPGSTPGPTTLLVAASASPRVPQHALLPLLLSHTAPVATPIVPAASQASQQLYLPLVQTGPPLMGAPLLGPASGSAEQAIAWLAARDIYNNDIVRIVNLYQRIGEKVGLDWFLAIAQMAHETGSLTSWWSQPPRRNPAGIGVTGAWR